MMMNVIKLIKKRYKNYKCKTVTYLKLEMSFIKGIIRSNLIKYILTSHH
jgi:hypothetical protein